MLRFQKERSGCCSSPMKSLPSEGLGGAAHCGFEGVDVVAGDGQQVPQEEEVRFPSSSAHSTQDPPQYEGFAGQSLFHRFPQLLRTRQSAPRLIPLYVLELYAHGDPLWQQ
jgi:hypothetical protein